MQNCLRCDRGRRRLRNIISNMEFQKTIFKDAWLLKPQVFEDDRGFFIESFSQKWFQEKGIDITFVQDNHSKSIEKGVLRGLHFQLPPHAQTKFVRVTSGSVFDVIVDLRNGSETYGQWQGFELRSDNFLMLFIPEGFAHAFCTLEQNTEFCYKVDSYYTPESDSGILWNDPTLNIDWPVTCPIISEKDSTLQTFIDFQTPFNA